MLKQLPKKYQKIKNKKNETQDYQHKKNRGAELQHNLDQPFCTKSETDLQEKPR